MSSEKKPGERLVDAAKEAVAVAKGEAAAIWHYMDAKTVAAYGPWVRKTDHEATIEALRAERDEANEELGKVIMACPPGSRGMPIHPHVSALRSRLETTEARVAQLEAALGWYGKKARLCRLIHSEGDAGRHALSEDGGRRARALLTNGETK